MPFYGAREKNFPNFIYHGLVSSMPFRFPFHLPVLLYNYYFSEINMLKSCWPIHFQIISPTFQKNLIRCATLKRFAAFAPISFVVQWNVIPNDNIQSFQLSFELLFYQNIKLEVNLLDQNVNELENELSRIYSHVQNSPPFGLFMK